MSVRPTTLERINRQTSNFVCISEYLFRQTSKQMVSLVTFFRDPAKHASFLMLQSCLLFIIMSLYFLLVQRKSLPSHYLLMTSGNL